MTELVPASQTAVAASATAVEPAPVASTEPAVFEPTALSVGATLSQEDRSIIGNLTQSLAAEGLTDGRIGEATARWYNKFERAHSEALLRKDQGDRDSNRAALQARWGVKYTENVGRVRTFLASLPSAVRTLLETSRVGDTAALNNSQVCSWLLALCSSGSGDLKDLRREREEIEHVMRTNRPRYNRDEHMQARYRELLTLFPSP